MSDVQRTITIATLRKIARAIPDTTGITDPVARRAIDALSELSRSLLYALLGLDTSKPKEADVGAHSPVELEEGENVTIEQLGDQRFRIAASGDGSPAPSVPSVSLTAIIGWNWNPVDRRFEITKQECKVLEVVGDPVVEYDDDVIGHSTL